LQPLPEGLAPPGTHPEISVDVGGEFEINEEPGEESMETNRPGPGKMRPVFGQALQLPSSCPSCCLEKSEFNMAGFPFTDHAKALLDWFAPSRTGDYGQNVPPRSDLPELGNYKFSGDW